jgi:hypothetical protein
VIAPVNVPGVLYTRVEPYAREPGARRWVGRCKSCKIVHRVEGLIGHGWHGNRAESVVLTAEGTVYRGADQGAHTTVLFVACGNHRAKLERVYDDSKPGKPRHECNAKCLASTGPACECRCRGRNHGAGR